MRNKRTLQRGLAKPYRPRLKPPPRKYPMAHFPKRRPPCLKQTLQKDPPLRRPLPPRKSPFWQTNLPSLP